MEFKRLFEIPYYQLENYPQEKALGRKDGKGGWKFWSMKEFIDQANQLSLGLLDLGVKPGDKIAVLSYINRPEWNIVDIAAQQVGAITVPVYPTISPREYEYIFNDAEVKYCFLGLDHGKKESLTSKIKKAAPNIPSLQKTFCFDETSEAPHWETLFKKGDLSKVEAIKDSIKTDDLVTLIYTSGTTGDPKGVMLTHKNIASNVSAVLPYIPLEQGDKALSFLPLCHIFERNTCYTYIAHGVSVYYTGTDTLGGEDGDLAKVKPHFFTTVPRLLEKVYERIYNKGLELEGVKKKLFFWALSLTDDFEFDQQHGPIRNIQNKIADALIFSKWRAALGGNIKGVVTGAAPCPPKMTKIFSAAGIQIREGYGLTETSPALTINRFNKGGALLGTVGMIVDGVELKIDSSDGDYKEGEGEILAKGPNIMKGYYNKPEATAEVMSKDGWFHTGDIGKLVKDKNGTTFVKITGRKKALLKTSGGKYVAPEPIEKSFTERFLIEQMMVIGEGKKFVSGLIVPAAVALKDWCEEHGITCKISPSEHDETTFKVDPQVLSNPKVLQLFEDIVKEVNPHFSHIEQIKKFKLMTEPWTIGSGELTPTLKVKRRVIMEKCNQVIEEIYDV